mmetsp:Transcript_29138/g.53165  ORF Transcript_29138/g.53165 Transcript_29138/m.53165 type:complete len:564 (+) Transcript_29138:121-1812(+)
MLAREIANSPAGRQVANQAWYSLRSCPFFKNCDPKFLESILEELEVEVYHEGDAIITEGEVGDTMFFLNHGEVEVIVGKSTVSRLHSGSYFGEMTLLGLSRVRSATVRALEFCDCRTLHSRSFRKVLANFPEEKVQFRALALNRKGQAGREANIQRRKSGRLTAMQRRSQQLSPRSPRPSTSLGSRKEALPEKKQMLDSVCGQVWASSQGSRRVTEPALSAQPKRGTPRAAWANAYRSSSRLSELLGPAPVEHEDERIEEAGAVSGIENNRFVTFQPEAVQGSTSGAESDAKRNSFEKEPLVKEVDIHSRPVPPPISSPTAMSTSPMLEQSPSVASSRQDQSRPSTASSKASHAAQDLLQLKFAELYQDDHRPKSAKVPVHPPMPPRTAKEFWEVLSYQPRAADALEAQNEADERPCRTPELRVPLAHHRVRDSPLRSRCPSRQDPSRPSSRASDNWMQAVRLFGFQAHPPNMPPPVPRPLPGLPDPEEKPLDMLPMTTEPQRPSPRRHPLSARSNRQRATPNRGAKVEVRATRQLRPWEWEWHSPDLVDDPPPPAMGSVWDG